MISLDTETTGLDLRHGARPFFVSTCDDNNSQVFWEWDVDPLTRTPIIPDGDLDEIRDYLFSDGPSGPIGNATSDLSDSTAGLILHNSKFDFTALDSVKFFDPLDLPTVWSSVRDTLLAAHLLTSNLPHDLTACAVRYLGIDIEPYELRLKKAVEECRRLCRSKYKNWKIWKEDLAGWPTKTKHVWKNDTWLPRAVAIEQNLPPEHEYWSVLRDYANADTSTTLYVWRRMLEEIKRRKLLNIYRYRLGKLPVAFKMESRGITLNAANLNTIKTEYENASKKAGELCVTIATSYGHDLQLPKSGVNDNLRSFMFDKLDLEPRYSKKSKTDAPTLNKEAMEYYQLTLPKRSKQHLFVQNLLSKRARDTAIMYMESYQRFWRPFDDTNAVIDFYVLNPNLNPTGTSTLRWSCSNPNEQNISKRGIDAQCPDCRGNGCKRCKDQGQISYNLRYCFGPAKRREWWSLDAQNIELRLPAYESKEPELIGLFEEPDKPPFYGSNHMLVFSILWPELWEDAMKKYGPEKAASFCKKEYKDTYYQWTKNGNFAVQYGAIDREDGTGTADRAYHQPGAHSRIKSRFNKMAALNDWCISFAEKHGYIETMPDKTVDPERGYPLMCTRSEWGKILPTVPLNYRVQGSAMWWMGGAMMRVQSAMDEWNRRIPPERLKDEGYFVVMQVHDEMVFDFPKRANPKIDPKRSNLGRIREIQKLMAVGGDYLGVPTPVSCEYHDNNWSEGVGV